MMFHTKQYTHYYKIGNYDLQIDTFEVINLWYNQLFPKVATMQYV